MILVVEYLDNFNKIHEEILEVMNMYVSTFFWSLALI